MYLKMKTSLLLLSAAFSLCGASAVMAQGQMNMICSSPQKICDIVTREFSKATGIDTSFIRLSTGEAYARIRAEARNPKADVWFSGTNEPHYQAAFEGLTHSYKSPHIANLLPQAQKMAEDTDYRSVSYGMGAIGFVYNTQVLEEKNIPEPKCWADLLKPEFKGEIAFSNPNTAGTGYSTLVSLVALMGEDEAFDYMKKLNANVASYTKSGQAVASQPGQGEVALGIAFLSNANMVVAQGFPLVTTTPCEGTGYALHGVSIIEGARNLDQAKVFMDWILSPEGQAAEASSKSYIYPTAIGTKRLELTEDITQIKLLDLDQKFYGAPEKRKELLGRWDREIGAIAGR